MTPEQRSALEDAKGTPLTEADLLAIEPLLDPENRNDVAIAAVLSAERFTSREIEAWRAKKLLVKRLRWRSIAEAADDSQHPAREAAYAAVVLAESSNMMIDLCDPVSTNLLAALEASNLIDASTKLALQQLSRVDHPVDLMAMSRALNSAEGRLNG